MTSWQDLFNKEREIFNINDKIDALAKAFKKWVWVSTILIIIGLSMIISSIRGSSVLTGVGIVVAISGFINIAVLKIWMHIKLSTLLLIMELRKRSS